ncbi:MAG: hypothetical protein ACRERC_18230 [Candidatus Binatia bacterium]
MTRQLAFVGRFLAVFALLIFAGWLTGAPRAYAAALRTTASALSPLVNGWSLEQRAEASGRQEIWFRRGTAEMRLQLGLEPLALSLLPLLSLFGATPGMAAARRAARAAIGVGLLFALDLVVLLLYPWLVGSPNALTDIVGTFLGLLTFVGGPVILWFVLTYRELRGVWRLT